MLTVVFQFSQLNPPKWFRYFIPKPLLVIFNFFASKGKIKTRCLYKKQKYLHYNINIYLIFNNNTVFFSND